MEALKKQQLGIMTEYDELVIDSVELSMQFTLSSHTLTVGNL